MTSFMRARTREQVDERQNEIINACRELFDEGGYGAVSFRTIGEKTSFSRPSIYNYYDNKDEVFLDLLKLEYDSWRESIEKIREAGIPSSKEAYAKAVTESLWGHERLCHLMSLHYTAISCSCSLERLMAFQQAIQPFFDAFASLLSSTFPKASKEKQDRFRILFFSLMSGLYPLTHLTENQAAALKSSAPDYDAPDFFKTLYAGVLTLTEDL